MRWQTLREGIWFLVSLGFLTWVGARVNRCLGFFFASLFGFTLYFFRDPDRIPPRKDIVAPADGKVVEITELDGVDGVEGPAVRIGIFLSVFDVHTNRMPVDATVLSSVERTGEYLDARNPESSRRNACRTWLFEGLHGRFVVRQITGAIARRIVPWSKVGDKLKQGDRFGMIRFGSRTEIDLPRSVTVTCKMGQKIRGGETVIAQF